MKLGAVLYVGGALCLLIFLFAISPWLGFGVILLFLAGMWSGLKNILAPAPSKVEENSEIKEDDPAA